MRNIKYTRNWFEINILGLPNKMKNKPLTKKDIHSKTGRIDVEDVISAKEWLKQEIDEMDIWVSTKKEIKELIKQAFDVGEKKY